MRRASRSPSSPTSPASARAHPGSRIIDGYLAAIAALDPTAWAVLGSAVIIATPAVGLVVTALEYESIGDRRAVLMALAVLAILATSLAVAVLT